MKKLFATIAVSALALVGTVTQVEARPYGGHGYGAPQPVVYVSGYHHGRPIYTEKRFVGYDCYGRPSYSYRTVSAPYRGNRGGYDQHCDTGYGGGYGGGYDRGHRSDYYNQGRSGTTVSFSYRR